MSFEIIDHDLHGRIGKLYTRHGIIRTPTLAPVINPLRSPFPLEFFEKKFKVDLVITNAYIIWKNYGEKAIEKGIHELLGLNVPIMTDSGAYQILEYGYIDVDPDFILRYQKVIGSDIGVILDIPSGAGGTKYSVEWSVKETLRRARRAKMLWDIDGQGMLLVAPIQGGTRLELVEMSARSVASLNYDIYALGSPTQIMENYDFETLVDMMATARSHIPITKPMHLFGAGHPIMLSLAVALGYDLFDSASYVLYARNGRYILPEGTLRIENITKELPCECPICSNIDIESLKEMPEEEKVAKIAQHNLYVIMREIKLIREAIREGTLMRLLELRSRAHPLLYRAYRRLRKYIRLLERCDPITKPEVRGLFIFDGHTVHVNPKIVRYKEWLMERFFTNRQYAILLPAPSVKPFSIDPRVRNFLNKLEDKGIYPELCDILFYSEVFNLVPIELCEVYPLSQFEKGEIGHVKEELEDLIEYIESFIRRRKYRKTFIILSKKWPLRFFRELSSKGVEVLEGKLEKALERIERSIVLS